MLGTFLILTLPGDNDTWSVTLWAPSGDRPLKEFRNVDKFTKVVQACPFHSQWLQGEPISDVLAMAGILDRYRRFVIDEHASGDRVGGSRRCLGVHEPVGGTWTLGRSAPRPTTS